MTRTTRLLILAGLGASAVMLPTAGAGAATPPGTGSAQLSLVLPLSANTGGLERYATEVATPGSRLYRHYRSVTWLAQRYGASVATQRRVVRYMRAHGAGRVRLDRTGLFVDATLSKGRAESLFAISLVRRGSRANAYTAPSRQAKIPAGLAGAVTGVVGFDTQSVLSAPAVTHASAAATRAATPVTAGAATVKSAFSSLNAPIAPTDVDQGSGYKTATGTPSGCRAAKAVGGFTPNQYLSAYDYTPLQVTRTLGQGERIALIEVDGFKKSDINTFARCFGLHAPKIVAFRTDIGVAKAGLPPGGEATLDLEVLDAAAPKLSQIDVYETSADIANALHAVTAPLQNSRDMPQVISVSLGLCEPEVRSAIGQGGMRDVEAALEEAAASGISVLAASGDDGSADCVDSSSTNALPLPELAVNFPASSPFVTAVGGTNLVLNPANQIEAQRVWNDDQVAPGSAGGGGLSTVFSRPSYQKGLSNTNQRVVPDVAMLADIGPGYDVYCSAKPECVSSAAGETDPWQSVGGTSASTPLLAGGFALVDQLLREHKQQSLGLANPLLYGLGVNPTENPQVFSDVSIGSNDVGPFIQDSGEPLGCCSAGAGFDGASGWGSVYLANFANAALTAQPALVDVVQAIPDGQKPVRAGHILDRVACSGICQIGAFARIAVAHEKTVTLHSGIYHLPAAGTKLVKIAISKAERTKLRSALAQHRRITATLTAAIVDPGGNIERRTPAQTLKITH